MPFLIYDYLDENNVNVVKEWILKNVQKKQRIKLNQKIDALSLHGLTLIPNILTGTHIGGIQKIRVKGNVQLRPLLCIHHGKIVEFTFLNGGKEVGGDWQPVNAVEIADLNKTSLLTDMANRRIIHVRVN